MSRQTGRSWFREVRPVVGLAFAVIGAVAASQLRHGFIEPQAVTALCEDSTPLWWCPLRIDLIVFLQWGGPGLLTMALAAVAIGCRSIGWRTTVPALAGMAIGGAGLELYNATLSAIGLVLCTLLLAGGRRQTDMGETDKFTPEPGQPGSCESKTAGSP